MRWASLSTSALYFKVTPAEIVQAARTAAGGHALAGIDPRRYKLWLVGDRLAGSGVNIVNGDSSRGAAGLWIENGQPAWPVGEITIPGNLARMIQSLEAVGDDCQWPLKK